MLQNIHQENILLKERVEALEEENKQKAELGKLIQDQ